MTAVQIVVLAGGDGERLWPLSRRDRPRAFLPLAGPSPLQAAVTLGQSVGDVLVVCRDEHRFIAAEQLRESAGSATLLLEPCPRGDGAALALALSHAPTDAVLVVLPAETPAETLGPAIDVAVHAARAHGRWTTMVADERVLADVVRREDVEAVLQRVAPGVVDAARQAYAGRRRDLDFVRVDEAAWEASGTLALEALRAAGGATRRAVQAGHGLHSLADLGSVGTPDDGGNVLAGDVVCIGSSRNVVRAADRLVALVDVQDLVVVETADAVLVAPADVGDRVRDVVAALHRMQRDEVHRHRRTLRPWGAFERLAEGARWQAKRIVVEPGGALSLQRHKERAEHWVVVRGRARITRGDDVVELTVDESTYIPRGVLHRLENASDEPLEIVEIQTGDRLDEADIERVEDRYGRDR